MRVRWVFWGQVGVLPFSNHSLFTFHPVSRRPLVDQQYDLISPETYQDVYSFLKSLSLEPSQADSIIESVHLSRFRGHVLNGQWTAVVHAYSIGSNADWGAYRHNCDHNIFADGPDGNGGLNGGWIDIERGMVSMEMPF